MKGISEEEISTLDAYLILGSKSYAEDVMSGKAYLIRQIQEMKKDLSKPVALVFVTPIDERHKTIIRKTFKVFKKRVEIEWDPTKSFDMDKLRKLLDE